MNSIPAKFKGDAAAAIAYLAHENGWTPTEVLETLLNIGLDLQDQGVFADVEGQPQPMPGVTTMEAYMPNVGDLVTDPEGNCARIIEFGRIDGNVTVKVTTDVNSAVTTKVDANTHYVWRLADLARGRASAR